MSIADFAQHATLPYFDSRSGELLVGGRGVAELASELGQTPFYAYDRAIMARKVAELRAALPADVELHYAIKANPMPGVVEHLASLVDGLDVASARELRVALGTRTAPQDISFAGPGKSATDLVEAVGAGIVINMESELEMRRIAELARQTGKRPKVAIRVNPDFELKTSGMKMGGGPKQFGVDSERVPAMLAELAGLPLEFWGFHLYTGSQNLRAESIIDAQHKCAALAIELAAHAPAPVRMLNLGGGFGIPYFPGDRPLELEPIGANLRELVPEIRAQLPEAQVVIELGRYLVGESGVYVCRVVDRKISRGHVYLVTDGGLHHHLAASGNFGQVIRRNYPVAIANRIGAATREIASVVGPLCTPLDLLADRAELAQAEVGDLVAVFMSGAYGYTASPLGFLSHPEPAQLLVG
jgi:diaminopimelate decarboxylase